MISERALTMLTLVFFYALLAVSMTLTVDLCAGSFFGFVLGWILKEAHVAAMMQQGAVVAFQLEDNEE